MQTIKIGRYNHPSITDEYAGWIEGEREDKTSWIMFLNASGSPECFYAARDEDGGVIGEAVALG